MSCGRRRRYVTSFIYWQTGRLKAFCVASIQIKGLLVYRFVAWLDDRPKSPKVMIAIPHRRIFFDEFMQSCMKLQRPPESAIVFTSGQPLDNTRNQFVSRMLAEDCDYLFFLDDDIVTEPDTLHKLIMSKTHVVSGVYFTRGAPYECVASYQGQSLAKSEFGKNELIQVDYTGCGCLLVHHSVFRKIGKNLKWRCLLDHTAEGAPTASFVYEKAEQNKFLCPYCKGLLVATFFEHTHGKRDDGFIGSEDFYFCKLAKDAGYPVLVRADALCAHLTIAKITIDGIVTSIRRGDVTS